MFMFQNLTPMKIVYSIKPSVMLSESTYSSNMYESKHCRCLHAIAQIHIHIMHAEDSCFSQECLSRRRKVCMCVRGAYAINMNAVVWIVYYLYGVLLLAANKTRAGCFL
jgi:hypothetical protein